MSSSAPISTVDGRRARRDHNRERVVDALLELYREGELQPAVADVAERSGVSHRSVFRYFDDLDELYRVAIERQYAAVADLWKIARIGEGSLADRVERIVTQRLELYAVAAPVARVGHMRAPTEPVLAEHLRKSAAQAVEQIRAHFAPELDNMRSAARDAAAEAATAALSMEMMEFLCFIRGLDQQETAAAMTAMVMGLFGSESS